MAWTQSMVFKSDFNIQEYEVMQLKLSESERLSTHGSELAFKRQLTACRSLIQLIPGALVTPGFNNLKLVQLAISKSTLQSSVNLNNILTQLGVEFLRKEPASARCLQACLRFTVESLLCPSWSKFSRWLVHGEDPLRKQTPMEAVDLEILVTDSELYFSMQAGKLKIQPFDITDLGLEDDKLKYFLSDSTAVLSRNSVSFGTTVHVLPSMRQAYVSSITRRIPTTCPYRELSCFVDHWKCTHGIEIPSDSSSTYYVNINFSATGTTYTYPHWCVHTRSPFLLRRYDPEPTMQKFLSDVNRLDLNIFVSPVANVPVKSMATAAEAKKEGNLELATQTHSTQATAPYRTVDPKPTLKQQNIFEMLSRFKSSTATQNATQSTSAQAILLPFPERTPQPGAHKEITAARTEQDAQNIDRKVPTVSKDRYRPSTPQGGRVSNAATVNLGANKVVTPKTKREIRSQQPATADTAQSGNPSHPTDPLTRLPNGGRQSGNPSHPTDPLTRLPNGGSKPQLVTNPTQPTPGLSQNSHYSGATVKLQGRDHMIYEQTTKAVKLSTAELADKFSTYFKAASAAPRLTLKPQERGQVKIAVIQPAQRVIPPGHERGSNIVQVVVPEETKGNSNAIKNAESIEEICDKKWTGEVFSEQERRDLTLHRGISSDAYIGFPSATQKKADSSEAESQIVKKFQPVFIKNKTAAQIARDRLALPPKSSQQKIIPQFAPKNKSFQPTVQKPLPMTSRDQSSTETVSSKVIPTFQANIRTNLHTPARPIFNQKQPAGHTKGNLDRLMNPDQQNKHSPLRKPMKITAAKGSPRIPVICTQDVVKSQAQNSPMNRTVKPIARAPGSISVTGKPIEGLSALPTQPVIGSFSPTPKQMKSLAFPATDSPALSGSFSAIDRSSVVINKDSSQTGVPKKRNKLEDKDKDSSGQPAPKKTRAPPKVAADANVEELAKLGQLSKVNAATVTAWLKSRGVPVRSKDKRQDLNDKVLDILGLRV